MPLLTTKPPHTVEEPVTEIFHGLQVVDPYRWLEQQNSANTRDWIDEQSDYLGAYLENVPSRQRIRDRVNQMLDVETCDSLQAVGGRYIFRKRVRGKEQPAIYLREEADGHDHLLVDPAEFASGKYTAVQPLRLSRDGRLLLYEVKEGGERTGTFKILDIDSRKNLADSLPRGYLLGFAFASDARSFYYVHEPARAEATLSRIAMRHDLGTPFRDDQQIFSAPTEANIRLILLSDTTRLGFLVYRYAEKTFTSFYLMSLGDVSSVEPVLLDVDYLVCPVLAQGRIFVLSDLAAPNFRIVELRFGEKERVEWFEVVRESNDRIRQWSVLSDRILVTYVRNSTTRIEAFDFSGHPRDGIPVEDGRSLRIQGVSPARNEIFLESESFSEPRSLRRYSLTSKEQQLWSKSTVPFDANACTHVRDSYPTRDGTRIPINLFGRREALASRPAPVIMTAYGGFGVSATPQFSILVALLVEHGCLFALPGIRGGSEFGAKWHAAAMHRNRKVAYEDFLAAAEWLIETGRTTADQLAIFGGSNSGLLVLTAMVLRPELFRAILCIAPLADMLRYHLFDNAHVWRAEFGTAEDPDDFAALCGYSPYQLIRRGTRYPATMIVSGDADGNCNPLHARKITARLQAANTSENPILLAYTSFRGHSPVLPLSQRVESLANRVAFLLDQLQLPV